MQGVLEAADGLAKCLALKDVVHGELQCALRRGDSLGRDAQALAGQFRHHDDKALVERIRARVGRDHIAELGESAVYIPTEFQRLPMPC